ncbi:MAG TPA: hypothetical protein DIC64_03420 [Alphaproteobacteria bacterium]|nr:hypothetical protein [Alphaproteobacteria bacterium]
MKNIPHTCQFSLPDVSAKSRPDPAISSESFGRSMVEMLGVLAIIGVLSAGALAGYSKAMFRHKVNQTIDIFQGVLQRLAEMDQQNLGAEDFAVNIDNATNIVKYGILNQCQETTVNTRWTSSACQLPIGVLELDLFNSPYLEGMVFVNFTDAKSCIAFCSVHWERVIPVEWVKPSGYLRIGADGYEYPYEGDGATISKIAEDCTTQCKEGSCYLNLMIREY